MRLLAEVGPGVGGAQRAAHRADKKYKERESGGFEASRSEIYNESTKEAVPDYPNS